MSENKHQTIIIAIDDYVSNRTEEEARAEMWKDISSFLQILTKTNHIAVVYDDDTDIIVIEFEHNEHRDPMGYANPHWITEEEEWYLEHYKETSEEEELDNEQY